MIRHFQQAEEDLGDSIRQPIMNSTIPFELNQNDTPESASLKIKELAQALVQLKNFKSTSTKLAE